MTRSIRVLLVMLLLLCCAGASRLWAGELEDMLIAAAVNGDADGVRHYLDGGADPSAKDSSGETALMKAAYFGYTDIVRALLDHGASVEPKNSSGETALQLAQIKGHTEIVNMLNNALASNPAAAFTEAVNDFEKAPWKEENREKVVQAAAGIARLPAVPDDAKQKFIAATAQLKSLQASHDATAGDLQKPIQLLNEALQLAPWWANAYYNLALAQEVAGQYDDALKQLNYYLELKPSEADATGARARITVIQGEKESAALKKQQNENLLTVKYVSGGIARVRYNDAPAWWHNSGRMDTLYTYAVREEDPFYANVFRMPNGYLLTISLRAVSSNGAYAGDRIAVYAWNVADGGCNEGYTFAYGEHGYTEPCGVHYDVSVSNQNDPNAFVSVTYTPTGASVTVPVALLYRGRALRGSGMWGWGSCGDGTVYQGSHEGGEVLHFDCSKVQAALDPNVNAMGLTPTTVTPVPK